MSLVLGLGYYVNGVWSLWRKAIWGFRGQASLYKHIRITVRVKIVPLMQMFGRFRSRSASYQMKITHKALRLTTKSFLPNTTKLPSTDCKSECLSSN